MQKVAQSRWNTDPRPVTSMSPYATFANNPIWGSDPNGDSTTYFNSAGDLLHQSHDGLENAIVSIADNKLHAFNTFLGLSYDKNSNDVNKGLRSFGTGYAVNEFKSFFINNSEDHDNDWAAGYTNEHGDYLAEDDNKMVRLKGYNFIGAPNTMAGAEDRKSGEIWGGAYSEDGRLHIHTNVGLSRYPTGTYSHNPSRPDGKYIPGKIHYDIVVSDKYIYFINNTKAHPIVVPFNKTFTTKATNGWNE